MKILLDSSTPASLAYALQGHEVLHTGQLGWHSCEDGALLTAAEAAGFDILLTCDQSIPFQQNLTSNRWPLVRPVAAQIAAVAVFLQRGQVKWIDLHSL